MIFLLPTYRLTLFLLVLCFAVSAMAQDGRTVRVLTTKQEMSTAGKAAPCFSEPDLAKSRQRESEAIASLPKIARFWLAEDAVYIISPEERCAFLHLATDEERNQFIEQFWSRRARDPTSLDNSFKREHYERIVFANETFSGQLPGWKTDQGRIYVTFGPPDSIESHQRGEKTGRPPEEGPETYEFSWEAWHYKRIDGVGENIEVKFVDPSGSGDYRLALGPEEKELFFAPAHNLGLARKEGTAQATQAIEIYVGPAPVPLVHFKDLEAMVVSRITRHQVQLSHRIEFAQATQATTLTRIFVDVPRNQQSSSSNSGKPFTEFEVFGRVSKPSGWVVDTFERRIFLEAQGSQADTEFHLALAPGAYRLAIVVRDSANGDTGTLYTALDVPPYERAKEK
jgi:GWxTD domain-containing protein